MDLTAESIIEQEKHLRGFFPFLEIAIYLKKLPFHFQIAFFASCYERVLPIYILVNGENGWGDISILRSVGDDLWQIAGGMEIQEKTISSLIERTKSIFIEGYDEGSGNYSDSREGAIYLLIIEQFSDFTTRILNYIENDTPETYLKIFVDLIYIVREYFSTYFPNIDPEWEFKKSEGQKSRIELNTVVMQAELWKEFEDLELLEKIPKLTSEILSNFRDNACPNGMSILGSLDEVRANLEW